MSGSSFRFLLGISSIIIAVSKGVEGISFGCSSIGTDFVFGIPTNSDGSTVSVRLIIIPARSTHVQGEVCVGGKVAGGCSMFVGNGKVVLKMQSILQIPMKNGTFPSIIALTTSGMTPISLQVDSETNSGFSIGSFTVLPTHSIGFKYTAITPSDIAYPNQILIINPTTSDNTVSLGFNGQYKFVTIPPRSIYSYVQMADLTSWRLHEQ